MLTTVLLDGAMGRKFGHRWELSVNSVGQAMRLINANKPGFLLWVRNNLARYDRYKIICTYENGRTEYLDDDTVKMNCKPKTIRFVPVIAGAGAGVRMVIGATLLVVGWMAAGSVVFSWAAPYLIATGASLLIGGIVETLTKSSKADDYERKDRTSYAFDGPVNTEGQGVPIPLIYGPKVLVGSHAASAILTVDQLI